jgi:hypothetical protein
MSREEIQKLLGGYATDTLGEAERRALFEAALEDQELFDALAKEQALREVLQDPSARQQLIEALGPAREAFAARTWHWLRQPAALAMAGGMAALLIVGGLVLRQTKRQVRREVLMTDVIAPRPASPAVVVPSTAPLQATRPSAVERQPKRLAKAPALRSPPAQPLAQHLMAPANLPAAPAAPPALTGAQPAASPPPPPRGLAVGLAGAAEAKRQALQTTQAPVLSFNARSGLPRASMTRAKAARPVAANLGVEYTLLLKDADGAYSPVPASAVFHAGDSVRLQVEPSEAGYIYLFQRDATVGWNLLTSQRAEKAQRYVLPSTGGLQSDTPARLELLLVLSQIEQPAFTTPQTADVDALASGASTLSAAIPVPGEPGVYLVDTRQPAGRPQASFKIMIEYR